MASLLSRKDAQAAGLLYFLRATFVGAAMSPRRLCVTGYCRECRREKAIGWSKKWRDNDYQRYLDVNRKSVKAWRDRHPQRSRDFVKAYRHKYPDRVQALADKWAKSNPEKVRRIKACSKAKRRLAEGRFTTKDIEKILALQKGKCAYCRCGIRDSYQVDHIVAVTKGGSNWPSNIQLCCRPCNTRKNALDPLDFARSTGRLL